MNKNNRGISTVVATVLIILITIAAVAIIWAAIIPLITEQIDTGTACLGAVTEVEIVRDYSCIRTDPVTGQQNVELQIRAGAKSADKGLSNIEILIDVAGTTTAYKVVNDESGSVTLKTGGAAPTEVPKPNTATVYVVSNVAGSISGVQIAPIVTQGNSVDRCDAGTKVTLQACA